MQNVPKIVVKRLHSPAAESHPDADLLTAFAEQSLAGSERDGVLQHLARCGDCREVIALALPATQDATLTQSESASGIGWFRLPVLRWGFVAATVIAVASVAVVQYKEHRPEMVAISTNVTPSDQLTTDRLSEKRSPESAPSAPPAPHTARAHSALTTQKRTPSAPASLARSQPTRGAGTGGGVISGSIQRNPEPTASGSQTPLPAPENQAAQVTVQASAQNQSEDQPTMNGLPEPSQADLVAKAKPALPPGSPVGMAPAPMLRADPSLMKTQGAPRWTISSSGLLQRSSDGGQTWTDVNITDNASSKMIRSAQSRIQNRMKKSETVAHAGAPSADEAEPEPDATQPSPSAAAAPAMKSVGAQSGQSAPTIFRALSVSSDEVWVGGSGAALYHTADGGNVWVRVLPSDAGIALTGDIVSIQFSDPHNGTVTTSNAEVWTTPDAGQTWRKQP